MKRGPESHRFGFEEISNHKDDLALMMIVRDQTGQMILSLPFFPGC
jgi:hypothetical protein